MKDVYILAIESSCDETSMAIVKNGKDVISLTIASQIDTHAEYGGVVPEIASRMHTEAITYVLEDTLKKASMKMEDIDAIAVTHAPGLTGSLIVGIEAAKTLSLIYNKPLIGVNHLIGHIYANNLENNMEYPLLALVISGGHTELLVMEDDYKFRKLGETLDDAIGEAYDKVARVIGLKYPGGPNVEKYALSGNHSYNLPKPVLDNTYNFSYSGLKSAIINLVHNAEQRGEVINKEDLARSFQDVAVDELVRKVELAFKETNIKRLVIAGGVSANKYLQQEMTSLCNKYNAKLLIPRLIYCTDNAAMIGAAAYPKYLKKEFSDYTLNASSSEDIC
ncbi:MAG: tRNA (adenosine(37)-N6)-threonylcarbamoyltransferase complex transferase subunit TsaD [Ruminococcus sp.]|nr:tRNA (adenosine(37)-N6)-threonylcarbamoyltransferase complex transferase subunit TsaD [Ruminococcus sp.]